MLTKPSGRGRSGTHRPPLRRARSPVEKLEQALGEPFARFRAHGRVEQSQPAEAALLLRVPGSAAGTPGSRTPTGSVRARLKPQQSLSREPGTSRRSRRTVFAGVEDASAQQKLQQSQRSAPGGGVEPNALLQLDSRSSRHAATVGAPRGKRNARSAAPYKSSSIQEPRRTRSAGVLHARAISQAVRGGVTTEEERASLASISDDLSIEMMLRPSETIYVEFPCLIVVEFGLSEREATVAFTNEALHLVEYASSPHTETASSTMASRAPFSRSTPLPTMQEAVAERQEGIDHSRTAPSRFTPPPATSMTAARETEAVAPPTRITERWTAYRFANLVACPKRYLLEPQAVELRCRDPLADDETLLLVFRRDQCEEVLRTLDDAGVVVLVDVASSTATSNTLTLVHESVGWPNGAAIAAGFVFQSYQESLGLLNTILSGVGTSPAELRLGRGSQSAVSRIEVAACCAELWVDEKLSNFEFLMALNRLAGRSFVHLPEYPVVPWILAKAGYEGPLLDLGDPDVYRPLAKPTGAIDNRRAREFRKRFLQMTETCQEMELMREEERQLGQRQSSEPPAPSSGGTSAVPARSNPNFLSRRSVSNPALAPSGVSHVRGGALPVND